MDLSILLALSQEHLYFTCSEGSVEEHRQACQLYLKAGADPRFTDSRGFRWLVTESGLVDDE